MMLASYRFHYVTSKQFYAINCLVSIFFFSAGCAAGDKSMMSLVYLLGYFALAINVVHGHNSSFSLEMKNLLLCQAASLHSDVSLYRSEVVAVQADLTNCEPSSVIIDHYNVLQYKSRLSRDLFVLIVSF